MTFKEIQELIRQFSKTNLGELIVEQKDFKIKMRSNESCQKVITSSESVFASPQVMPTQQVAPVAPPKVEATPAPKTETKTSATKIIKAPMIGTFYRSSGPDKDPFVKVGDRVEVGQVICIIEAMKLFNEIESDMSGVITKVLVNDATPIEYDQPLFEVE